MKKLNLDNLSREEARNIVRNLPRNKEFVIDFLSDGRRVYIRTDGKRISHENGKEVSGLDITVHYDGEPKRKISYIDDIFYPLIQIEILFRVHRLNFSQIIKAIKDAIQLTPIKEIFIKYPELKNFDRRLKELGIESTIEFLLALIKALGIQEDINHWGINPETGKPYEGREKPYNAIVDLFVNNLSIRTVILKHKLF